MKKLNNVISILIITFLFFLTDCTLMISNDFQYENIAKLALILEFVFALIIDILLGGGCIIVGVILMYKGMSGNAVVMVEINSIKATIINCTPGMFLVIAGFFILFTNRFSVKLGIKESSKKKINKILIPLYIILIIGAILLCFYGAINANNNGIEWLQKQ